jgi:hypothetical protein
MPINAPVLLFTAGFNLCALESLCLCVKNVLAACSLTSAATAVQIVQRWHYGSDPLQWRQFSALSRASRRHKMSIQRLLGGLPPAISAETMHNLRNLRILCSGLLS